MRIGLNLGYGGTGDTGDTATNLAPAGKADELGHAVVWAAEAYGTDAVTILTWLAARTRRIDAGSADPRAGVKTLSVTPYGEPSDCEAARRTAVDALELAGVA